MALSDLTVGILDSTYQPEKTAISDANYRSSFDFTTEFMPDLHQEIIKRYANESLTGFLELIGNEQEFGSDLHYWAEESRMHRAYSAAAIVGNGSTNQLTITGHALRKKETIMVYDQDGNSDEMLITAVVDANTVTVAPYSTADLSTWDTDESSGNLYVFVTGAEQKKGGAGMSGAINRNPSIYSNKPIIMPGVYEVTNSDLAQISWLRDANGSEYWFLMDIERQRETFLSNLEKKMVLSKSIGASSGLESTDYGTSGLFEQMRERGNNYEGYLDSYADLKTIIKRLDKQSGERYNVGFFSRDQKFKWDEIFAGLNPNTSTGVDYGVFPNGKEMAMDLGFSGASWGGYNFYATTWKMLKDPTGLGSDSIPEASRVNGVMLPMGETMATTGGAYADASSNSREAINYLTLMYRGMPGYSRKFEEFVLGSGRVKPATVADDKLEVHWRTERMLRLAGANKTFIFEGSES